MTAGEVKFEQGTIVKVDNEELIGYGIVEELRLEFPKPYVIIILAFTKKHTDRNLFRVTASEDQLSIAPDHILEEFKHIKGILVHSAHLVHVSTVFLDSVIKNNLKADTKVLKEVGSDLRRVRKLFKDSGIDCK